LSLIDTLREGIETAFGAVPDLVSIGDYYRKTGNGNYDPGSDTLVPGANKISPVRFLKTSSGLQEREASPVAITDVKFLIPAVDLPGVTPGENDQVVVDGGRYNIVVSRFGPGQALHIVFGRRA
jgi:hypothetical protein